MSKKYLIISIVTLIVIVGGVGLYYFLGVKEEIGVIPPPTPSPEVQKVETEMGVSGEIITLFNTESTSGSVTSTNFSGSQLQIFNDVEFGLSFNYPSEWNIQSTPDTFGGNISGTRIDIQTTEYEKRNPDGEIDKGNISIQLFVSKNKGIYDVIYGMFFGEEHKKSFTNKKGETVYILILIDYLTSSPLSETSPGIEEYMIEISRINNTYKPMIDAMITSMGLSSEN